MIFLSIAVIAAVKKETGHWKWALFMMAYTTTQAWVVAFVVYQVGGGIVWGLNYKRGCQS